MRALLVGRLMMSSLSFARDPFAPPTELTPPPSSCTTSLCQRELSTLKLVAIVARGPESVAMFEDPLGKGLVARKNAQIGTLGARVTQIDRACLTLTRFVNAQAVKERICLEGAASTSEHDYLTDAPYRIP